MYLGTFNLILASFIAACLCAVPDDSLKSFETAAKNYNDDVLEMSNADIKKKTSLLDSGKLGSIAKKMKALSKVAGPLVMLASVLFFEDEEAVRYEILRLRIFKTQNDITIQTCGSHE